MLWGLTGQMSTIFLTHAVIALISGISNHPWLVSIMHKLLLLFDLLCSFEHGYSWAYSWAVCHLLSTVTQVSNQIISLLHAVTHCEKNDQVPYHQASRKNMYRSTGLFIFKGKHSHFLKRQNDQRQISALLYAHRPHTVCVAQKYAVPEVLSFCNGGFFFPLHRPSQVLFIAISIYFWTTLGCEQLLNDAVKHYWLNTFFTL